MPLPPALLAKLSKRGIVAPNKIQPKPIKKDEFKGYVYCPNKVNIYHSCTTWCEMHWKGHTTPDPVYAKNIQKLLFKYPLPNNWTEVFDKGVGKYYYWNIENDLVSWLPPKHPKSKVSKSAAQLREQVLSSKKDKEKDSEEKSSEDKEFKKPHSRNSSSSKRENERDKKDERHSSKKLRKDNVLDPMDPASYSDISPGTWSDGLENNKSNADSTASGVLYQQRPYPSPGEVLSSNKEKHSKKH